MKTFLTNLLVIIYLIGSIGLMILAIVYPFALSFDDHPPYWTCWILYPLVLIIIASQNQAFGWIAKTTKVNNEH